MCGLFIHSFPDQARVCCLVPLSWDGLGGGYAILYVRPRSSDRVWMPPHPANYGTTSPITRTAKAVEAEVARAREAGERK